jgi:hypothetical protein
MPTLLPAPLALIRPATAEGQEPDLTFAELRCRAQHANEILRAHLLADAVPPLHRETLRQ